MHGDFPVTLYHTFKAYLLWFRIWLKTKFVNSYKTKKNKRHFVLLVRAFPPFISSGVYRPVSIVKYAIKYGWEVTVIAGPYSGETNSAGDQLLASLPPQCNIHFVKFTKEIKPGYRFFPRIDGGFLNALRVVGFSLEKLNKNVPSIVMASGPQFSSFISAFYLSQIYSSKLVLDYRDEWTECPFNFVAPTRFDRIWESRCLKMADRVFFTTLSQLNHQVEIFNELEAEKCQVIPNGWEPSDFSNSNKSNFLADKNNKKQTREISFIGALGDHTLPNEFLNLVEKVFSKRNDLRNHIRLQFVGRKSAIALNQIKDFKFQQNIILIDHVNKSQAALLMRKSAALLIFYDQSFERYIPGKLYDYIASGNPVLLFGKKGEAVDIIRDLEAGFIICADNADLLEKVFDKLLLSSFPEISSSSKRNTWLENMTREVSVKKILDVFSSL